MREKSAKKPRRRDILGSLMAVQGVFTLTAGVVVVGDSWRVLDRPGVRILAGSTVLMSLAWAVLSALRARRVLSAERTRAEAASQLMETVLTTSHEWLWALDEQGDFIFSSPTSTDLTGYHPSELVGKHFSIVADVEGVPEAIRSLINAPGVEGRARGIVRCRHRDGSTVWIESSTHNRPVRAGQPAGLEGTSRRVPVETAREAATALSRTRIRGMIDGNKLLTAFQPIRNLAAGHIIGAEALTRFLSEDGTGPECWFNEAAAVGLSEDLEIAALETALKAAQGLPSGIYVALNVAPSTCLDPRLPGILERSGLALERIVLELTERLEVEEYSPSSRPWSHCAAAACVSPSTTPARVSPPCGMYCTSGPTSSNWTAPSLQASMTTRADKHSAPRWRSLHAGSAPPLSRRASKPRRN